MLRFVLRRGAWKTGTVGALDISRPPTAHLGGCDSSLDRRLFRYKQGVPERCGSCLRGPARTSCFCLAESGVARACVAEPYCAVERKTEVSSARFYDCRRIRAPRSMDPDPHGISSRPIRSFLPCRKGYRGVRSPQVAGERVASGTPRSLHSPWRRSSASAVYVTARGWR